MSEFHFLVSGLGVGLAVIILLLVRRDHLYLRHGLFWMGVAGVSVVLGIWPNIVDRIGQATGVAYPPALLFLLAIMMLIVRAVVVDMAFTRLKREVRLLNQRMALVEGEHYIHSGEESPHQGDPFLDADLESAPNVMEPSETMRGASSRRRGLGS